jgi:arsenite methyltransferase
MTGSKQMKSIQTEQIVKRRYSSAAAQAEPALCCATQYRPELLEHIPPEVLERDYGCGDPSRYIATGETVLDLGSGTGKICFIAARVVGPGGKVIGIDMTDEMLEVARRNAPLVAERLGYANVEFRKGRIQDLALDLERLEHELAAHPVTDVASFLAVETSTNRWRHEEPLVASDSIDVIVSNCVLNLVEPRSKRQMFAEIFRVLRPGGRAVIADIVSNQPVPALLQNDPELWSGCISGALTEDGFVKAFAQAGFQELEILTREVQPWRVVGGIEFRSMTVRAFKGSRENLGRPEQFDPSPLLVQMPGGHQTSHDSGRAPAMCCDPADSCCKP